MATGRITKAAVDALQAGGAPVYLWDDELSGFGLKVSPGGAKTYLVQYRLGGRAGKTRRLTIGRHGALTPTEARKEAQKAIGKVAAEQDPAAERSARRRSWNEALFSAVMADYIERHAKLKTRTWREAERSLTKDVLPAWKNKPIAKIGRPDVRDLLDKIMDRGAPALANRLKAVISGVFEFAVERGYMPANPVAGLSNPAPMVKRDRVLDDAELRLIRHAMGKVEGTFGAFLKLLLWTGQRRGEVAAVQWSHIDLKAGIWTLPPSETKNGREHVVPLPPPALELLNSLPRIAESPYVFPARGKPQQPMNGFNRPMVALHGHLKASAEEAGQEVPPSWTLHDMRRTAATRMADLGTLPHVVEAILNHVSGSRSGVAETYNRSTYLPEKRRALELWCSNVEGHGGDNVIPLRQS